MFKLLFLTHTGTGQPPAALFIARQLIQDADLEDRIEAERGVSRVLCKSIQ